MYKKKLREQLFFMSQRPSEKTEGGSDRML